MGLPATPGVGPVQPGVYTFTFDSTNWNKPVLVTVNAVNNSNVMDPHFATIIQSIDRRIFAAFSPDTLVLPGHGDATTVGNESPHLAEWVERGW